MKSIDKNVEVRRAWLRQEQGLPPEIPSGNTAYCPSDFERSTIWRVAFIAAFIVGIVNLVEPAPRSNLAPAPAQDARVAVHPTV